MKPHDRAALEEERRFLLGSIRDLEREHAVGDVATADFNALRDGYVARTAAVLLELNSETTTAQSESRRPWHQLIAVVAITLVVAVGLGIFVARSAGQRLPGQGLTGGQPADEVAVYLAEGRRLMNVGQRNESLIAYEQALELEPSNVEAITYAAWLGVLTAVDANGVQLGIQQLADATQLDETYADPHCLLALAVANFAGQRDNELVQREAQACADLNPPADMRPLIDELLATSP